MDRRAQWRHGVRGSPAHHQRRPEAELEVRVPGGERQRPLEQLRPFRRPTLHHQQASELIERLEEVGLEPHRPPVLILGLRKASGARVQHAEQAGRFGIGGRLQLRRLELRDRLLVLALVRKQEAEIETGLGVLGRDLERLAQVAHRLVELALLAEGGPQPVQHRRRSRSELLHVTAERHRVVPGALRGAHSARLEQQHDRDQRQHRRLHRSRSAPHHRGESGADREQHPEHREVHVLVRGDDPAVLHQAERGRQRHDEVQPGHQRAPHAAPQRQQQQGQADHRDDHRRDHGVGRHERRGWHVDRREVHRAHQFAEVEREQVRRSQRPQRQIGDQRDHRRSQREQEIGPFLEPGARRHPAQRPRVQQQQQERERDRGRFRQHREHEEPERRRAPPPRGTPHALDVGQDRTEREEGCQQSLALTDPRHRLDGLRMEPEQQCRDRSCQHRAEQAVDQQQHQHRAADVQDQAGAMVDGEVGGASADGVVHHQRGHRERQVVALHRRRVQHLAEEAPGRCPSGTRDERVVPHEQRVVEAVGLGLQDRCVRPRHERSDQEQRGQEWEALHAMGSSPGSDTEGPARSRAFGEFRTL